MHANSGRRRLDGRGTEIHVLNNLCARTPFDEHAPSCVIDSPRRKLPAARAAQRQCIENAALSQIWRCDVRIAPQQHDLAHVGRSNEKAEVAAHLRHAVGSEAAHLDGEAGQLARVCRVRESVDARDGGERRGKGGPARQRRLRREGLQGGGRAASRPARRAGAEAAVPDQRAHRVPSLAAAARAAGRATAAAPNPRPPDPE